MLVCLCHGVSDRVLEPLVQELCAAGRGTVEAVTDRCRAGGSCGACRGEIQSLIDRRRAARAPRLLMVQDAACAAK